MILQRLGKRVINILSLLSFLALLPAGLLFSGTFSLILKNKLGFDLFTMTPYQEILWFLTNILWGFSSFKFSRITDRKFFFENRFRFSQLIYLIFGFIYYSEPFTSTESLNRYIFLFFFMLLSIAIELTLHYSTRLKAKRVFKTI